MDLKRNVLIILGIILLVGTVSASGFAYDNPALPNIEEEQIITYRNVTDTNSSDFWDNLDSPSDINVNDLISISDYYLKNNPFSFFNLSNISFFDNRFVSISGDTMTGILYLDAVGTGLDVLHSAEIGNHLIVGDDLTVDTDTLFVDSGNNRVGIGTLTPNRPLTVDGTIGATGIFTQHTAGLQSSLKRASDTYYNYPYQAYYRSRGTLAVPTAVQANDYIGATNFYGYNGVGYVGVAGFNALVTGINGDYLLGRLNFVVSDGSDGGANFNAFYVTPTVTSFNTASTLFTGNVGIGTSTPQNRLNVIGDINSTGNFINNANTGITGNYSVGSCWLGFSGGIMYSTNCTAL